MIALRGYKRSESNASIVRAHSEPCSCAAFADCGCTVASDSIQGFALCSSTCGLAVMVKDLKKVTWKSLREQVARPRGGPDSNDAKGPIRVGADCAGYCSHVARLNCRRLFLQI